MTVRDPRPPLAVVLVHGTFSPHAKWSKSNSDFVKALSAALGPKADFQEFNWSGANSHTARLAAGREFAVFLRSAFALHPQHQYVVVAHSHGGTVTLYALQDEEIRRRISAIVCLSTPFFNCRSRELWGQKALELIIFVLMAIAVVLLGQLLKFLDPLMATLDEVFARLHDWGVPELLLTVVAFVCVCLPLLLVATELIPELVGRFVNGINDWVSKHGSVRVSQVNPVLSDAPPILCLVFKADEARLWLRGLPMIAELPNATRSTVARVVGTWLGLVWIGGAFLINRFLPSLGLVWAVGLFLVPLLFTIVLLFLPILTIATSILVRTHRLAFGERVLDNLVMRTRVDRTPCNVSPPPELVELTLTESWYKRPVLRHSFIYEDPRTPNIVARWARSKFANSTK